MERMMSTNATLAEPGNVSEIQSLTERVQRLSGSVDDANKWLIWSLVVAAAAAIFVGLATYAVIARGKRLVDAQNLLNAAKDRELATDLGGKDVEIGKAKIEAAKAGKEAGDAALKAAQIAHENLQLQATVEGEKSTRLELEKSLAPREFFIGSVSGISSSAPLKTDRITCRIETIADEEARRAGSNIASVLQGAGWKIPSFDAIFGARFRDGVTIWFRRYVGVRGPDAAADKSEHAAVLLTAFLLAHDWKDIRMEWVSGNEPLASIADRPTIATINTIVVRIGFKHSPYFHDPALGDNPMYSYLDNVLEIRRLTAEMRAQKEQLESALEKMKPELLKRQEESDRLFEDAIRRAEELRRQ
jgi:hypothetical protein